MVVKIRNSNEPSKVTVFRLLSIHLIKFSPSMHWSLSLFSSLVPLQAFINNFQQAKDALAEVTVQAAEKAATGVLELAEKSTRISLDVNIKAPVVFLPQSSISTNVIVADLGLVTVQNHFEIVPSQSHTKIPPILDIMSVALSDLKMYRWGTGTHPCSASKLLYFLLYLSC